MSDDELFDLYAQDGKTLIKCLREIYQQGRADQLQETQKQFDLMYADKMEQVRIDERERIVKILEDNWLRGTVARDNL